MAGKPLPVPDDAIWYYAQGGLSCAAVATMFHVSESTVNRWMRDAGVIRTEDQKKGRPPAEKCSKGHDQSKWRRGKPGSTYCGACANDRARARYAENKPQRYGKESGSFAKPHPVEPGACPNCGAYPPCEPLPMEK